MSLRISPLLRAAGALSSGALVALACTSSNPANDGGTDASTDAPLSCSSPGQATPGPADDHCSGQPVQTTSAASCHPDAGADDAGDDDGGTTDSCDYGDTMFGQAGDDDDCKYHVTWTSTPICEGSEGVTFTVTATNLTDNSPVTNIPVGGMKFESFIPTVADASCDDQTTHTGPNTFSNMTETPAGSGVYVGSVQFDAPGDWTLRFHFHEECSDDLDDSPHGHAAFHITVP
jgi:hypothetical protein